MPKTPFEFDAVDWVVRRYSGLSGFSRENIQSALDFALVWSLFESECCKKFVRAKDLGVIAKRLGNKKSLAVPADKIFAFLRERYWTAADAQKRFKNLRIRDDNHKDILQSSFKGDDLEFGELKIHAVLIVTYRYRNNFFHGNKSAREILKSGELFARSAAFLSHVIEHCGNGE